MDLQHLHIAILDGELHIHEAGDVKRTRHQRRLALDFRNHLGRQRIRRQAASGIAGMYPRLFDMFHDSADEHLPAVGQAIAIDRSEERRVGEECVSTCRTRWSPDHYKKKQHNTSTSKLEAQTDE